MDPIVLSRGVAIAKDDVSLEYSRASGPGGQHVNKTETRVTLRFDLLGAKAIPEADRTRMVQQLASRVTKSGEVLISCDSYRDRARNIETAWERLGALLRRAYAKPKARKKTRPSRGAKERRLEEKRHIKGRKAGRQSPRGEE